MTSIELLKCYDQVRFVIRSMDVENHTQFDLWSILPPWIKTVMRIVEKSV